MQESIKMNTLTLLEGVRYLAAVNKHTYHIEENGTVIHPIGKMLLEDVTEKVLRGLEGYQPCSWCNRLRPRRLHQKSHP